MVYELFQASEGIFENIGILMPPTAFTLTSSEGLLSSDPAGTLIKVGKYNWCFKCTRILIFIRVTSYRIVKIDQMYLEYIERWKGDLLSDF